MNNHNSDSDWEHFAKDDPYWAVLTQEKFHKKNLDEKTKAEFFASGEEYIEWVFDTIRKQVSPEFNPRTGLDFGCGVGRLVIPLASRCETAIGVDVSESMLREAKAACETKGARNVKLVQGVDKLSGLERDLDFINSFIVFQHIPCERGLEAFRQLLGRLAEGGCGALHFTYSLGFYTGDAETYPVKYGTFVSTGRQDFKYHLKGLARAVKRRVKSLLGRDSSKPVMQMNPYLLNPIMQCLQQAGVKQFHAAFSDHTGALGLVLFFKKESKADFLMGCLNE